MSHDELDPRKSPTEMIAVRCHITISDQEIMIVDGFIIKGKTVEIPEFFFSNPLQRQVDACVCEQTLSANWSFNS